jgi:outer membrane receptor protein involved in Fe transport
MMLLLAPDKNRKPNLTANKLAILAGISSLSMIGAATQAQDRASESGAVVPEIIVTAQKREENVNTVPMSITAVTGEQLERAGVTEVRDLVKVSPGFSYADSYVGSPIYTLRGIGFSDISLGGRSTVSLYVDQAPIPFAIESRGVNLDLERVEILKGPQGTLFGQNATGGAINFIAAKPTRSLVAGLDASYGSFNASNLTGFISGPLSETLGARLAVQSVKSDPWQRSYTTGAKNGADDVQNTRLTVAWDPTARLKVQLNLNGSVDKSDVQAGQLIAITPSVPAAAPFIPGLLTYPLSPANARAADFNPSDDYSKNNRFLQATARIDYTVSDSLTLTSLTSASQFKQDQLQDVDGTSLSNLNRHTRGKIKSFSQEIRMAGDLNSQTRYTLGLSYADDDVREASQNNLAQSSQSLLFTAFGLPRFTGFGDTNNQKSQTTAVFANADYDVSDAIKLYGGARYTRSDNKFSGCTTDPGDGSSAAIFGPFWNSIRPGLSLPFNPPIAKGGCVTASATFAPGLVVDSLNESNVSWRLGGEWKPRERTLIYANVSKGYKAGGFPSLGATAASQYLPATQESVIAYETGFKTTTGDRKLHLDGAVFYYDYQDKQILGRVLDPLFGPLLQMINVPKSKVSGAELQLSWLPIEGLSLTAGGSYVDSEVLDGFINYNPDGVLTNLGGEAFPNTPKWQFVSDVNYSWAINPQFRAFVGGGATHQGKTNSQLGELPTLNVKAYTLIDLRAGLESQDGVWRLSAWGRNVGDAYYWTAANRNLDTTVRFTGRPATYGLSLSYRYQ